MFIGGGKTILYDTIVTVNNVRFVISEEEYLALGLGTSLDHLRAFV